MCVFKNPICICGFHLECISVFFHCYRYNVSHTFPFPPTLYCFGLVTVCGYIKRKSYIQFSKFRFNVIWDAARRPRDSITILMVLSHTFSCYSRKTHIPSYRNILSQYYLFLCILYAYKNRCFRAFSGFSRFSIHVKLYEIRTHFYTLKRFT